MNNRVLIIAGGAYISGAEIVTLDVIRGLKDAGLDLHCMVNGWNDGDFINRLTEIGVSFTPIKLGWFYISKPLWTLDSLLHFPKAIHQFIRLKKNFKPDYIYTISFTQIVLLYPLINKKVIYHVHDNNFGNKRSLAMINLVDRKIESYIAVSNFIKEDLINCGVSKEKINVIHNGISSKEILIHTNTPSHVLRLAIVGQILPKKGHEDAIDALHLLKTQNQYVSLTIVGRGNQEFIAQLIQKIKLLNLNEAVTWRDFQVNKAEIYKNIDVLLVPTRTEEPFGLVAVEANLAGIPVIVANKGGLIEIVDHGVNGFIVEAYNPTEIAKTVKFFCDDRSLISKMGLNGHDKAIKQFEVARMVQSIKTLFQ